MKGFNIFTAFWIFIAVLLLVISFHYKKQSDAIVAQVEPQKTAISFQKAIKIKNIHVIPGEDVNMGDLLFEAERPDLIYDIEKSTNQLQSILEEKEMFVSNTNYQMQQNRLEKNSELKRLEEDIIRLKAQQQQNRRLLSSFGEQTSPSDSISDISLLEIRIRNLEQEKIRTHALYDQKYRQLQERKNDELDIYNLKIEQQNREINELDQEKNYLQNYSPIDGTIGDVYTQDGELLSPYTTVLSIYERHPTIIKAYMNEKNRYRVHVGDSVVVKSSNRKYSIPGFVAEIGSRIVSYPTRLLINQDLKIWGQEIFVRIPRENEFLNGEKVFVRVK